MEGVCFRTTSGSDKICGRSGGIMLTSLWLYPESEQVRMRDREFEGLSGLKHTWLELDVYHEPFLLPARET